MIRCDKRTIPFPIVNTWKVPKLSGWSSPRKKSVDAKLKKSLTRKSIQRGSEGPPKDNRKQIIRMLGKSCNNKNVLSWDHYWGWWRSSLCRSLESGINWQFPPLPPLHMNKQPKSAASAILIFLQPNIVNVYNGLNYGGWLMRPQPTWCAPKIPQNSLQIKASRGTDSCFKLNHGQNTVCGMFDSPVGLMAVEGFLGSLGDPGE